MQDLSRRLDDVLEVLSEDEGRTSLRNAADSSGNQKCNPEDHSILKRMNDCNNI